MISLMQRNLTSTFIITNTGKTQCKRIIEQFTNCVTDYDKKSEIKSLIDSLDAIESIDLDIADGFHA